MNKAPALDNVNKTLSLGVSKTSALYVNKAPYLDIARDPQNLGVNKALTWKM